MSLKYLLSADGTRQHNRYAYERVVDGDFEHDEQQRRKGEQVGPQSLGAA